MQSTDSTFARSLSPAPAGLAILGSTGSIGVQTLDIVARFPDRLRTVALAGRRVDLLRQQAAVYAPDVVCIARDDVSPDDLNGFPTGCTVVTGAAAMSDLAVAPLVDRVVVATVGGAGLRATLAAAAAGKVILLANKEVLVTAGELVTATVARCGAYLYPIDSEHSALWQCLAGEDPARVTNLLLTASGGALRRRPVDELSGVMPVDALRHPTWTMGQKVTIDSATLMNKGMEIIEARWLFDIGYERIDVVLHEQSIVHSLVSFCDGSIKAQLGRTDMRLPIQYALSYPDRWDSPDFSCAVNALGRLDFDTPDLSRYPCLTLARQAGTQGGGYPAVMSGADEVAVALFLAGHIRLTDIAIVIDHALQSYSGAVIPTLDDVLAAEQFGRDTAHQKAMSLDAPPWGAVVSA